MEAKAAGITFSVVPERERRRVKGTLELFLHSISKYLLSLSAVARGHVKDVICVSPTPKAPRYLQVQV